MKNTNNKPVFIRDWDELRGVLQESDTHTLEIGKYSGWLKPKEAIGNSYDGFHYLSTHTFYGDKHQYSSKILQECGFNVEIANWDKEN